MTQCISLRNRMKIVIVLVVIGMIFFILKRSCQETKDRVDKGIAVNVAINSFPSRLTEIKDSSFLSKDLLKQLLPELKEPRLMNLDDLGDTLDKETFLMGEFSFAMIGDLNNDGFPEIALAGKFKNSQHQDANTFVAIFSIKDGFARLEYFREQLRPRFVLFSESNYKNETQAVGITYSFGSEECAFVFWENGKYVSEACPMVFE